MNSKERVRAVFEGRAFDKVPLSHIAISSRVASAILGREAFVGGEINQWREAAALWAGPDEHKAFLEQARNDAIAIALATDQDIVRPRYWRLPRRPAARLDEHTFRYEDPDGTWSVRRLDPRTELFNTIASSPRRPLVLEALDEIVERAERDAASYAPTQQTFADERAALARLGATHEIRCVGPWTCIPLEEAWMEACLLRPDLVGRLLDAQAVTSLKNVEAIAAMGGSLCYGGGDMASETGPCYSPAVFRELVVPRLRRISARCRELGLYHLFGSDGNVWPVADDLYGSSGIHGHYEVDRKAGMKGAEVHARYPDIVMVGCLASHTLHTGSVAAVIAETRTCLEEARSTGRMIVGCSNIIMPETPPANVAAMLKTLADYR